MVQESRPWPGDVLMGSPGDAGPYNDGQWDDVWGILFGSEEPPYGNRGVIRNWEDELEVTNPVIAGQVDVETGAALVHGKFYRNTEVENVVGIDPAPGGVGGMWREDTILLRSDWVLQTIRIYWHKNPDNEATYDTPLSTDGTVWYIPLAAVRIDNGGVITLLTDLREWVMDLMHPAPAVRVYHDANQSILDANPTILNFNNEQFDNGVHFGGEMHNLTVNNSRLTCVLAGKYQITANIQFAGHAVGFRGLYLVLNGLTNLGAQNTPSVGAATDTSLCVTTLYDLDVGEYVEVEAWQTSGGALNVVSVGDSSPYFQMVRVAD